MTTIVVTKLPRLLHAATFGCERRVALGEERPAFVFRTVTVDRARLQADLERELRRLLGTEIIARRG